MGGIPETDAISLIVQGKAWASKNDPERVYRAKYVSIPAPQVVVLNHHVKMESFKIKEAKLTNINLFKRDKHTCQYCGRHKEYLRSNEKLTRDHVLPLSTGGVDKWSNVTTACSRCNHKKDNRTPEQAGMRVLSRPMVPVTWTIRGKSKLTQEQIDYIEILMRINKNVRWSSLL